MFDPKSLAYDCFAVTASDTKELPNNFVGFYVGVGGNVNVVTLAGRKVLFKGLPAGTSIPIRLRSIMASSTTATDIVGYLGAGK